MAALAEGRMVKLVSQEGDEFEVPWAAAQMAKLFSLEDEDEDGGKTLPVPKVKAGTLGKVIEFCIHHTTEPMGFTHATLSPPGEGLVKCTKALGSSDFSKEVPEWYAAFVAAPACSQELLFDLVLAANFMNIEPLLTLVCAKIASMNMAVAEAAEAATVGQSLDAAEAAATQGIRELYHIQHEFTDEDRVQVLAENPWVEGVPAPPAPSAAAGGGGAAEVEAK
jgi:S-phase kinase-associated protein 1